LSLRRAKKNDLSSSLCVRARQHMISLRIYPRFLEIDLKPLTEKIAKVG